MQATNDKPRQISALLVAALLTVTTFAVTASAVQLALPGFEDDDGFSVQSHGADILFNLTNFEQRAPLGSGSWDQSDNAATQTQASGYMTLLAADGGQIGGPSYRDVVFRSDISTGATQNNIFGFAFGLAFPTGTGSKLDTYILDWGGAEQDAFGYTKPEGFTLYHIDGQLPADTDPDFEDQQFACFWGKDDAGCTSATITVIAENHTAGHGWQNDGDYDLSLRYQEDLVRLHVAGEQFGAGETVIEAPGSYPAGEFALFDFRQEDITFSNAGYNDDIAPTVDLVDWCREGASVGGWCTVQARFRAENAEDLGSGVASVECFIDGVSIGDCLDTNTNLNDDGEYLVEVVVTDAAGNTETVSATLRVDTSAPTFDFETECGPAGESNGWCRDKALYSVANASSASGIESIECFLDGTSVGDCSTGNETTEDGVYTLVAVVSDNAGHTSTNSTILQVDSTLPELSASGQCATLMVPHDWCRSHVTLLSSSSALSGIADSGCKLTADHLGGAEVEDVDCGDTFAEDGEYTLTVNATSLADHFNETTTSFKLDTTRPIGEFITPNTGTSYLNGDTHPCLPGGTITIFGTPVNTPTCLASGEIEVVAVADDPIENDYNTGIMKVEFWDGVGDNMFRIDDATIYGDGDDGFYNLTWDTTRAPSPSEPHMFQTRTLEVRIWDVAGNAETIERSYFVVPPV